MRLFLALDLGEEVRRSVEQTLPRVRRHASAARWVDAGKLHLTLAFLGSVPEEKLAVAAACAGETAVRFGPPTILVKGAGTFGGTRRPRVLWAGIESEGLGPLQADLDTRLRESGFELEERAFHPHLTLARARDPRGDAGLARAAEMLGGEDWGTARPESLLVLESHLSPKGAHHEVRV